MARTCGMGGWMWDRRIDGWMDRLLHGWTTGWMAGRDLLRGIHMIDERVHIWLNELVWWVDNWFIMGQTHTWMPR